MKYILMVFGLWIIAFTSTAQKDSLAKGPTIGVHFFYNDFDTPQQFNANSFNYVLKNNLWNRPYKMQGGFGLDYFHGLTKNIDAIGTLNTSWVDYLVPPTFTPFGSSQLMLDINFGANTKLLSDRHIVSPYLITKAGFSSFQSQKGFNLIPGLGLQFTLFKEIYVNSTMEYRVPLGNQLSPQLYYSIGIARNIFKKKAPKPKPEIVIPVVEKAPDPIPEPEPVVLLTKNVTVTVNDEATGQPLELVEVTIKNNKGDVFTSITNEDGKAQFKELLEEDYEVSGRLNKINTTVSAIDKKEFSAQGNLLLQNLTHNDPRFTLVGVTIDIAANKPVGNTTVTITNNSQSSTTFVTSRESDGEFRSQLESASDFVIVGKKASYISNIENLSTKGLNRSATLYVKLQLGIEEAQAGKTLVLKKIFFATGKSDLNTTTSQDLQKLIQFMQDNESTKLEIQGHTDNVGSMALNTRLSQERANSVVNFLVANGISISRLKATGYGPSRPIANNLTAEGKAQNRRVEMKVIE